MKMKIISFLLALFMTATLISCSDKDENTVPEQSGDILYYFVGGHLVGSLEDGRFISATDREKDYSDKDRYRLYTIAELFSEKYLRFDIDSADAEVNEASIYTGQGPGGFDEDVTDRFTPYAIRTTDYGNVVIPIPCDFSGGMTDVYAPTYGFYVNMAKELKTDTDYPALTTNSDKVSLPDGLSWDCGFTQRDENEVLRIQKADDGYILSLPADGALTLSSKCLPTNYASPALRFTVAWWENLSSGS